MFWGWDHRRYRGCCGVGIRGDIGDVWGQGYRAHWRYRGCFGVRDHRRNRGCFRVRVIGLIGDIGYVVGSGITGDIGDIWG